MTGLQKSTETTPKSDSDWDRIKDLYTILLSTGLSNSSVAVKQNSEIYKFFDNEKKLETQMKQRDEELKREQEARQPSNEGSNEMKNYSSYSYDPFACFVFIIICFVFAIVFVIACIRSPFCTAYLCLRIILNDGRHRDSCYWP